MNAGTVVELALGLPTLLAGGGVLVARLTRIAVAVEQGTTAINKLVSQVDDHERRLTKGGL